MTKHKALFFFFFSGIFIFGVFAQSDCNSKKNKNAAINAISNQNTMNSNKKPIETPMPSDNSEVKTLAEGSYGEMEKPFLFVGVRRNFNPCKGVQDCRRRNVILKSTISPHSGQKYGGYRVIKKTV